MKLLDYRGYEIHFPTSGGKAGTGLNRTCSIQVRLHSRIEAQFRFPTANDSLRRLALSKAKKFVDEALKKAGEV